MPYKDPEAQRRYQRQWQERRLAEMTPEQREELRAKKRIASRSRYRDRKHRDRRFDYATHNARLREMNAFTQSRASRQDAAWTPEEDAVVLQEGLTNFERALRLGRTYDAVRSRRKRLPRGLRGNRD